jgi:ABC-2 type transport system ATP-binding protein
MADVLTLTNLTKTYGTSRGVSNVSLAIETGTVVGFLGPNGAGKTTTISMLVDLIRPTSGTISIFGKDAQIDGVEIRSRIGFLAGDFALDEHLTGWQQLEYFGNLHGGINKKRVSELAERLTCNLDRKIQELSRGNRQKVGLISALMHDPELLIFDEPTSGLDPLIQAEFNKIIQEHKRAGKTAFISSHLLSEVQEICDRVAFIREGELIATQDMGSLANGLPKQVRIVSDNKAIKKALTGLKGIHILKASGGMFDCTYQGELQDLLKLLTKHPVRDLTIGEADLETVFMHYYQGKNHA